jgi:hypothetical protein
VAALDEADAVLGELTERIDDGVYGVHGWLLGEGRRDLAGAEAAEMEVGLRVFEVVDRSSGLLMKRVILKMGLSGFRS